MPRPNERDDRIYTRRSHPSHEETRGRDDDDARWEPEAHRRPRAPSSFDYREDYRENARGQERGGDFRSYASYVGSGDGYGRGPTYKPGRFGDLSRYAGADEYYDHGGERWNSHLGRREPGRPDSFEDRGSRGRENLARRYEEHEGPGEGMMDMVRSFFGVGPKNYRRSDARIEEDANEALYHDQHLDASGIEVSVKEGVITLAGTVPNRWSKLRAEDLLEDISGVHDVQNRLTLAKDGGYREEESILRWAGGTKEEANAGAAAGLGAQENADSLAGRSIFDNLAARGSADDAAATTGTSAITGGAGTEGAFAGSEAEGEGSGEGTFGSPGLAGTTSTGGFNNTVVVHPVDEEKSA